MPSRIDRIRPGDSVRIRNQRWRVTRRVPYDDVTVVEVAGVDPANRGSAAAFLLPFEPLEPLAASQVPQVVRPARWRRIARAALGDATPMPHALRTAARARVAIVPFQLEPALTITSGRGCRLLIADEVGLGKTIQAGLIVAEVFAREPDARALVVCPAGVREQWRHELASRFSLPAAVLDASAAARVAMGRGPNANPWTSTRLAVASIDYVKRPEVLRAFDALLWDIVVFDEAHSVAGVSDRAAAAAALASRGRRVVLLTATPHSGDEDAYRRLCGIGRLGNTPPIDRVPPQPGRRGDLVRAAHAIAARQAIASGERDASRAARVCAPRVGSGMWCRPWSKARHDGAHKTCVEQRRGVRAFRRAAHCTARGRTLRPDAVDVALPRTGRR